MRECFLCKVFPGGLELSRCDFCNEDGLICVGCDSMLRPGMREALANLWNRKHVHDSELPTHIRVAGARLSRALDAMHIVRVDLERVGLSQLSKRLSDLLTPIEALHQEVKDIGRGA